MKIKIQNENSVLDEIVFVCVCVCCIYKKRIKPKLCVHIKYIKNKNHLIKNRQTNNERLALNYKCLKMKNYISDRHAIITHEFIYYIHMVL